MSDQSSGLLDLGPGEGVSVSGGTDRFTKIVLEKGASLDITNQATVSVVTLTTGVDSVLTVEDGAAFTIAGMGGQRLGSLDIGAHGTLIEGNSLGIVEGVTFNGGYGDLVLDQSAGGPAQTTAIVGFGPTDTIDIAGTFSREVFEAGPNGGLGTLDLYDGSSPTESLVFSPGIDSSLFHFAPDGHGGTDINYGQPCFARGVRILTEHGEAAVEDIQIGKRLVTRSGALKPVKWIGRRSYSGRFAGNNPGVAPILIKQGALDDNIPRRDLYVSPNHAMYVDDCLIEAKHLVNGASIVQFPITDKVEYFHFELADHDIIYAEGAPTETFIDACSRQSFQNWREYAALYPDEGIARQEFCALRVDGGLVLEQVRHRLGTRAGLDSASSGQAELSGVLNGHLDQVDWTTLSGWACNADGPATPVMLEVEIDGAVIGCVVADQQRGDLERAGIGGGRHGFRIRLPQTLSPCERHVVSVRRVHDKAQLVGSPCMLEAAIGLDGARHDELQAALEAAVLQSGRETELSAAIAFMLTQLDRLVQLRADLAGMPAKRDQRLSGTGWSELIAAPQPNDLIQAATCLAA